VSGPDAQLELLPSEAPNVRRASLPLADLVGYEHASPSRELVELIAKLGLLQPVVVTGNPQTRYSIVEGRRRVKAILDAVVANGEVSTIREIAAQTGMPVQTVRRRLRLRGLAPALRAALDHGALSASVAEATASLGAQQQATLERRLADGEPLTLAAVRELARERTSQTVVELPSQVFADTEVPWRVTVRGHLHAALQTVPASSRDGALPQRIIAALALVESRQAEGSESSGKEVAH
jgi:hypothetical protein